MDTSERFEQYASEFFRFSLVDNKRSKRADLHAFLLLDSIFGGDSDIVQGAEHDKIYLCGDPEALTNVQILELVRCGVTYDEETDSLRMFS